MEQEKPVKKHKKLNIIVRLITLLVTVALLLGALALVVYRDELNLNALKRWITFHTLETSDTGEAAPFTHAGGNDLSLAYLENGILTASASGAHYYSFSGELYAEEVMVMEHPVLSASDTAGVVYDAGGQSLFLFRDRSEVFDLTLDGSGDLLSARVNDSGWLAVTAQQSGYKGSVTVYDNRQEKVIQISLSSTFLVDAAVSPDCKTVAVVTIGHSAGGFSSRLMLYPVDQKEPRLQVDLGSMTVLDLDYERDLLWILGEDRLLTVSVSDGTVHTHPFGRSYLKGCDLGGDGFALLLTSRYRAGSANQAVVLGPEAEVQASLPLTGQVLDHASSGGYCSILSGSVLTVYDRTLTEYAVLESIQGARHTDLAPSGSALLSNDQQAWLYIPD